MRSEMLGAYSPISWDGNPRLANHQWFLWTFKLNSVIAIVILGFQSKVLPFQGNPPEVLYLALPPLKIV
jgi:hypothetical protein